MSEKVVETKICKHCNSKFEIRDKDMKFYEKVSSVFAWIKYTIPVPTLCPYCRQQRRLSFRNERKLYKRKCDATWIDVASIYSPDKSFKVYEQDYWWSDKWDAMKYGRDYEFSKSFFEQYNDLFKVVPKRDVVKWTALVNCHYVIAIWACKDCYLLFDSSNSENCYYWNCLDFSQNCIDWYNMKDCIECYELIDCANCYKCFNSEKSINCNDSNYLYNCKNCNNCFWCVNLENKSFYIFNKEYTKTEYLKKMNTIIDNKDFKNQFNEFKLKFPKISNTIINSENAFWDLIYNSKDVYDSYEINDSNNIRYSLRVYQNNNDTVDTFKIINNCSKVYECWVIYKNCFWTYFSIDCWKECENIFYCSESKAIKNCFWCHWIHHKQYCILNKQYTKEQYEELVPKIIEHMMETWEWWEFFPSFISPFGYNETVANEYFPLSRDEVLNKRHPEFISGSIMHEFSKKHSIKDTETSSVWQSKNWPIFNRSDYESPFPKVDKIIPASKLPNNISNIPDDILNRAIECEITKKPFRIIKQELEFYRKHNLPIPRRHPDQRHFDRMALRNPRKLYDRKCDKCGKNIKTTYAPGRSEIVYCEECYNKEVY